MLGLRARSVGLHQRDIVQAIDQDRTIVRAWLMRGTLHLVAAADLRWMLQLLGPVFSRGNRSRHAQLGLDDDLKARGVRAIRNILGDAGPLTKAEIVERLQPFGIRLDPRTQAPIHLIAFAAMQGVCCLGPERGKGESTYVLLDDWISLDTSSHPTPGVLAMRYFQAFGPATVQDFASWSGLPMPAARSAANEVKAQFEHTMVEGQPALVPRGRLARWRHEPARRSVRLLPAFDTYLLGYRSRDLAVEPALQRRLQRGGGWPHPAIVVDGRVVAAWSLSRTVRRSSIRVEGHHPSLTRIGPQLQQEAADVGAFLGTGIDLQL